MVDATGLLYTGKGHVDLRQCFPIKINDLVITVDNGCADIKYSVVTKCFNDQFDTDAVDIANADTNNGPAFRSRTHIHKIEL